MAVPVRVEVAEDVGDIDALAVPGVDQPPVLGRRDTTVAVLVDGVEDGLGGGAGADRAGALHLMRRAPPADRPGSPAAGPVPP
ncbi:hypothetical protein ACWERI_13400 [Streptomyces collinus]